MKISLIAPVFNEALAIPLFYQAVRQEPLLQGSVLQIVFINDGSTDQTEQVVRGLIADDNEVLLINLSRNFGKEAALLAGLEYSSGDAVIPIDVDLQDPISVIPRMISEWKKGADVVLARRQDRSVDSRLKRYAAAFFYRVMNVIGSTRIEANVGDFRLMDRKVVDVIKALPEHELFMKGLLSWAGFHTVIVDYDRASRVAGQTKFNTRKLWHLALDGITSFSTVPLRIWTYIGCSLSLFAVCYGIFRTVDRLVMGNDIPDYSPLMAALLFFSGIQLIGIGVLGEYVGRIYMEAKHRPRYVVGSTVGIQSNLLGDS
ncbi:glycosyltransferase family 2 protein [Pseudomonas folii]|uniref:Glycosyltransferase family 2 protein n=1 Tax=Pseudomonas folii TaxID=2762593 RepID=A0ABR7AYI6_9PSED|nr:glycosyltransferase family 2 protein [Pseudomonas folii]MBC3949965.1 glycosyltransferase family 2 protein [Pseudomonas folii]